MSKISMYTAGGSFRGDYASGTVYRIKDIVRFSGHAYQAIKDNFSGVAPSNATYWEKIVNAPAYSGITATQAEFVSATTTGAAVGTRKYWYGQEWALEKTSDTAVRLRKIYQNCNCQCNCVCACECPANQPNMGNCTWDIGDGLKCNCACLLQSDCNYNSGYCNCSANCNDGNCYF